MWQSVPNSIATIIASSYCILFVSMMMQLWSQFFFNAHINVRIKKGNPLVIQRQVFLERTVVELVYKFDEKSVTHKKKMTFLWSIHLFKYSW